MRSYILAVPSVSNGAIVLRPTVLKTVAFVAPSLTHVLCYLLPVERNWRSLHAKFVDYFSWAVKLAEGFLLSCATYKSPPFYFNIGSVYHSVPFNVVKIDCFSALWSYIFSDMGLRLTDFNIFCRLIFSLSD